jgi:hypothetical protein
MTDMQTSLPLYTPMTDHKLLYAPMSDEMKCHICYTLPCAFHSISSNIDATHEPTLINKWYDPLHIIMWPCWFIDLDLTCFLPLSSSIDAKSCSSFTATWSIAPKLLTCPSRLQPVHQAKSCLDLLHLSHMTQCHVSYVMSFFITWVSPTTPPSHFHLHDIGCSHKCTYGLIIYVFQLNTY